MINIAESSHQSIPPIHVLVRGRQEGKFPFTCQAALVGLIWSSSPDSFAGPAWLGSSSRAQTAKPRLALQACKNALQRKLVDARPPSWQNTPCIATRSSKAAATVFWKTPPSPSPRRRFCRRAHAFVAPMHWQRRTRCRRPLRLAEGFPGHTRPRTCNTPSWAWLVAAVAHPQAGTAGRYHEEGPTELEQILNALWSLHTEDTSCTLRRRRKLVCQGCSNHLLHLGACYVVSGSGRTGSNQLLRLGGCRHRSCLASQNMLTCFGHREQLVVLLGKRCNSPALTKSHKQWFRKALTKDAVLVWPLCS